MDYSRKITLDFIKRYGDTDFITGLRALAIFLVFLIHSGGLGLREWGEMGNLFVSSGKYGVQIFFVISGFTIFYQIFERKTNINLFIKLRISRISAPYYPLLLITFLYISLGGFQFNSWADKFNNGSISISNLFSHFLFLSPYSIKWQNTILGVEWTLGIEIFYYVIFGALIYLQFVNISFKSLISFGALSCFISCSAIFIYYFFDMDRLYFNWLPIKYFYMFFLGAFAFYLRNLFMQRKITSSKRKFISEIFIAANITTYILLLVLDSLFQIKSLFIENYFVLSTSLIIIFYSEGGFLSKILVSPLFLFFGTINYSFYLLHYPVILIMNEFVNDLFLRHPLFILLVSTMISFFWYLIFEYNIYSLVRKKLISKKG
jgi:peptidoglycan/LPS O-acetylase OafA/YrhL